MPGAADKRIRILLRVADHSYDLHLILSHLYFADI